MAGSQSDSNRFSVRILTIDHYMATPIPGFDVCYSSFQGEKVNQVPIIRLYGSTPAGQKTCLHIHGALPYFYVPCSDVSLNPHQEVDDCTHAISLSLEKALKLKGNTGTKRQHVHGCSLVRGRKFYGYHSSEELFVKIYLYYPNDVARAAAHLLGGAVLERNLQPYESHIPYILQFLVDNNLYGMGHVHVSKLKFRHPVPNVFSPRKSYFCCQDTQGPDEFAATTAGFQADSSGCASFGSPVWIFSTIPGDWMWHPSSDIDASSGPQIHHIKRQSVCELEGDATVDDILNQQIKVYTSLSQTLSDVKMVQSLVPIWEEEYERTGMREANVPPDSSKLSPVDVLKTLSLGLELESRLTELCSEAKDSLTASQKDVRPMELVETPINEEEDMHDINDAGPTLLPSDLPTLEIIGSSEVKLSQAADMEALEILKWLASSQAAEDINSDDELVREIILSPLLPTTSIEKVLEKANLDYENESQQECQDILDSICGINDFGGMKELASLVVHPDGSPQTCDGEKILEMDDSGKTRLMLRPGGFTECTQVVAKNENESEKTPKLVLHNKSTAKEKNKKSLWGSLPFSVTLKMTQDQVKTGACLGENKDIASSSTGKDSRSRVHGSVKPVGSDVRDRNDTSTLVGCSVRDMMRRKRRYRVIPSECEPVKLKRVSSGMEQKETNPSLKHDMRKHMPLGLVGSADFKLTCQQAEFHDAIAYDSVSEASTSSSTEEREVPSSPLSKRQDSIASVLQGEFYQREDSVVGTVTETMCTPKSGSLSCVRPLESYRRDQLSCDDRMHQVVAQGSRTGMKTSGCREVRDSPLSGCREVRDRPLSGLQCSLPMAADVQDETVGLIGMTINKKPPVLDHNDFEYADERNYDEASGRSSDEVLPFFAGDCQGEKEVQNQYLKNREGKKLLEEAVLGVPTHYQNDGSFLYLLTTAFSPPSVDCVSRWLLHGDEGICKKVNTALVDPSSLKASCDLLLASQSAPDDCEKALGESGYPSHVGSNLQQVHQENNTILNVESKAHYGEKKTIFQNVEIRMKVNTNAVGSQDISQISGPDGKSMPTPLSQSGFRDPASIGAGQQLTLLSIEVHAESRGDLQPDPRYDAVNVLALAVQNDHDPMIEACVLLYGNIDHHKRNLDAISGCKIYVFHKEKDLFSHFVKVLCSYDPDILMGWDIQSGSLGFLAERAALLGIGLLNKISRTPSETNIAADIIETSENGNQDDVNADSLITDPYQLEETIVEDEWGRTHASGVHVGGRVVLNVWRLMRGELKLNMYTIEAVSEAVLRRRIPLIPNKVLNKWYSSGPGRARYRCIEYVTKRTKLNLEIMNQLDMINRTSELARVFGIEFFSVLSRGSQYRVESMLLRLAHTQNYLAISPGKQQVALQPAMECLPLVMEPQSCFYADPVVVLDFQSLYPSMIIAYNLCYSTCLGKVVPSKENILGVSSFSPDSRVLRDLKNQILLTPNGVMYAPSEIRKGVLPRLLDELLSTRIMVKQAMKKLGPSQQVLHRIFNARQLALKLISNVTYGYTAAGFSGRMPCAELADSIVQCGRGTLERAISFVNAHEAWNAEVVYGDTDSMFVLLKGRTVKESFRIGQEIASAVTAMNPYPVTLKMEKVYHPCFLLTKKRYVGYSYESPDQVEPVFDAKGIETVRRDTCAAVAKTMEQSLRLFFESQDISEVKAYLHRQWKRILSGRVSLQDFIFAKEVRLGTYSTRVSSLPPAAIVATKAMRADPRAEPRYGERVPYVVIHGEPGARLVDMVVDPLDLLAIDSPYRLNDLYYINKQIIPALQRVFGLVGVDLNQWFSEMPRPVREAFAKRPLSAANQHRTRIDYYYLSKHCILCGELVQGSAHLCDNCLKRESAATTAVIGRTSKLEKEMQHLAAICRHCGGGDWLVESGVKCNSLACSVFYERRKVQKEFQSISAVASEKGLYPKCIAEWF